MNELLIDRLKRARIEKEFKQQDVAEKLGIKANTISNWEKGRTEPDIDTFVKLCEIYDIDCASLLSDVYAFKRVKSDISLSEYDHVKRYRSLDNTGRTHVDTVLSWELDRVASTPAAIDSSTPLRVISYYQRLASAGTGEYLFDDVPTETIIVPEDGLSAQADFVIGINGQSMEPTYFDGDRVYVKKASEIQTGSIGVFTRGNECFVKELGNDRLISHNKKYDDIPASDDIRLVGEVIGKVDNI